MNKLDTVTNPEPVIWKANLRSSASLCSTAVGKIGAGFPVKSTSSRGVDACMIHRTWGDSTTKRDASLGCLWGCHGLEGLDNAINLSGKEGLLIIEVHRE